MKYKAVFFDIDGTLVPFGMHEVPASTREAITRIREQGVKVFICTGRHIEWIDNIGDMEVDGYVTVNGAMCTLADKRTVIFTRPIPDTRTSLPGVFAVGDVRAKALRQVVTAVSDGAVAVHYAEEYLAENW